MPPAARRPLLGASLLFLAAVIWGCAFIPQKYTVAHLPPLTATAIRFAIAAPLALLLAVVLGRGSLRAPGVHPKHAILLGVILFVAFALQTAALVYAPVARVSLITGMYAVFVPLFAPLVGQGRPTRAHWGGAVLAFTGLVGLCGVIGDRSAVSVPLNIGDVFVFLHAVVSAFQVLLLGKLAPRANPYALNAMQLTGVMILAVPAALLVDGMPDLSGIERDTWAAFGFLAVFSTVLAFTLQIAGQRHTSPPPAAVIMLLESPIGTLAALVLLNERMGIVQWLGALLVMGGVFISLRSEMRRSAALAELANRKDDANERGESAPRSPES